MWHSFWAIIFSLNLFFFSGFGARWLFSPGSFNKERSLLPNALELVTGYALTALACFFSLIIFGTLFYGGVITSLASFVAFYAYSNTAKWPIEPLHFTLNLGIKLAFLGVIFIVYLPCLVGWTAKFYLPDVFDLPKQVAAIIASSHATGWPAPNPYFPELPFAYNLLFYLPLGLIVRSFHQGKFFLPVFSCALLWVSWQTLGILEMMMKKFSFSRWQQCAGLLFATFICNLIPFMFFTDIPLGYLLAKEGLADFWIDAPLISYLFVPQHLFGALCIFSAWLLFNNHALKRRCFLYAILLSTAVLTTYVLAPVAVLSFFIFIFLDLANKDKFNPLMAVIFFLTLCLYFIFEAKLWAGDAKSLFGWPNHFGWSYLFFSEFPLVLGCLFSYCSYWQRLPSSDEKSNRQFKLSFALVCLSAIFILLISNDTDMKIKVALFLRLLLIIPSIIGFTWVWQKLRTFGLRVTFLLLPLSYLCCLSLLLMGYFCAQSFLPRPPNDYVLIKKMQRLPFDSKILFVNPEMTTAAVSGHLVFMDFSVYREDAYLPFRQRHIAKQFFDSHFPHLHEKQIDSIYSHSELISALPKEDKDLTVNS